MKNTDQRFLLVTVVINSPQKRACYFTDVDISVSRVSRASVHNIYPVKNGHPNESNILAVNIGENRVHLNKKISNSYGQGLPLEPR